MTESWKPIFSGEIHSNYLTGKSIQIYVERFQQYSSSKKSMKVFESNNYPLATDNLIQMGGTSDKLSTHKLSGNRPNKCRMQESPTVPKPLHIDLKQLTQGKDFEELECDNSVPAKFGTDEIKVSNFKTKEKPVFGSESKSSSHLQSDCTAIELPTKTQNIEIKINNMVYKPIYEKKQTCTKTSSPKTIVQSPSKLTPIRIQYGKLSKALLSRNSITPVAVNNLGITNRKLSQHLTSIQKVTSSKSIANSEQQLNSGEDQNMASSVVPYRMDSSSKLNYISKKGYFPFKATTNKRLLMLPENRKKINNVCQSNDPPCFEPKIQVFQELVQVLKDKDINPSCDNWLNQIYYKITSGEARANKEELQKPTDELRITASNQKTTNVKNRKRELNRSKAFYSKVRPYSVIDGCIKADIDISNATIVKSTKNETALNNKSSFYAKENTESCSELPNNIKQYTVCSHLKVMSPGGGSVLSHICLKCNQGNKKDIVINDLKFNFIELQKKIRKYTRNRVNPLSEEMKSRQERGIEDKFKPELGSKTNVMNFKEIPLSLKKNQLKIKNGFEIKVEKKTTDMRTSLPNQLILKKSTLFPSKIKNKKSLKNYQSLFQVKHCLAPKNVKIYPEMKAIPTQITAREKATQSQQKRSKSESPSRQDSYQFKDYPGLTGLNFRCSKTETLTDNYGPLSKLCKLNSNCTRTPQRSSTLEHVDYTA